MIAEYIGLIGYVLFLVPLLGAGGFAVGQAALAAKKLPIPFLLPALTGAATLFCAYRLEQATRWGELGWMLVLSWCGLALAGVLVGWIVSACRRGWQIRKGRQWDE